jgi:hypothetical protein
MFGLSNISMPNINYGSGLALPQGPDLNTMLKGGALASDPRFDLANALANTAQSSMPQAPPTQYYYDMQKMQQTHAQERTDFADQFKNEIQQRVNTVFENFHYEYDSTGKPNLIYGAESTTQREQRTTWENSTKATVKDNYQPTFDRYEAQTQSIIDQLSDQNVLKDSTKVQSLQDQLTQIDLQQRETTISCEQAVNNALYGNLPDPSTIKFKTVQEVVANDTNTNSVTNTTTNVITPTTNTTTNTTAKVSEAGTPVNVSVQVADLANTKTLTQTGALDGYDGSSAAKGEFMAKVDEFFQYKHYVFDSKGNVQIGTDGKPKLADGAESAQEKTWRYAGYQRNYDYLKSQNPSLTAAQIDKMNMNAIAGITPDTSTITMSTMNQAVIEKRVADFSGAKTLAQEGALAAFDGTQASKDAFMGRVDNLFGSYHYEFDKNGNVKMGTDNKPLLVDGAESADQKILRLAGYQKNFIYLQSQNPSLTGAQIDKMNLNAIASITYDPGTIKMVTQQIPVSNPTALIDTTPTPNTSTQIVSETQTTVNNTTVIKESIVADLSASKPLSQYVNQEYGEFRTTWTQQESEEKNSVAGQAITTYQQEVKAYTANQQNLLAQLQNGGYAVDSNTAQFFQSNSSFFQT